MLSCTEAREWIHLLLDGDTLETDRQQKLHAHLANCADCRLAEADLRRIQAALGWLPESPLPDDALEDVLRRTVRSSGGRRRTWHYGWRATAAAAVVVIAAGVWLFRPMDPAVAEGPTPEQIRQAEQVRMVLRLTGGALRKTERAAMNRILSHEVSPALQQVPVKFPSARTAAARRSKS